MPEPFYVKALLDECRDPYARERVNTADAVVVVHRTIWEPDSAVGVCKRFQWYGITDIDGDKYEGLASYTGGNNPYTFIVEPDGAAVQCLPLTGPGSRGAHARRWNSSGIGVALMHDTLRSPLPHEMGRTLNRLLELLCLYVGGVDKLFGHDELPGASKDPDKICPGINMSSVRSIVGEKLKERNDLPSDRVLLLLAGSGIVLTEET